MNYKDYLNSKEWKEKSLYIKQIFGFKCWFCGSTINLNVHHTKYFKTTFRTKRLRWFLCICNDCHNSIHNLQKCNHLEVYEATKLFRDKLYPKKRMWMTKKEIRKARKSL